jgi:uncharacterized protein involved in exopolysaccharide biosynthesis
VSNPEAYLNDEIDLGSVLRLLWRRRWWIVAAVALGSSSALGLSMLMPPVYRASVVMVPVNDGGADGALGSAVGQLGGLASLVGLNVGSGGSRTPEALAVLRSRRFLESFFAEEQLLPILFSKHWNASTKSWAVTGDRVPTAGDAYRFFAKRVLNVSEDKKTSLVTLSINWRNPDQAADWANKLTSRLNGEMRLRAQQQADASVGFLKKELDSTLDIGTREAVNRLMEVEIKRRMLANTRQEYAFRVVERAFAPELKDKVSPQKLLMVVMGLVLALFLSLVGIFLYESFRKDAQLKVR